MLFAVHMADEITGASNLLPFKVVADDSQTGYTLSSSCFFRAMYVSGLLP